VVESDGGAHVSIGWVTVTVVVVAAAWAAVRWVRSAHLEALRATPLFAGLPRKQLMSVLRSTKAADFPAGSAITTQGERGKGFFIITRGQVVVVVDATNVATLGSGSSFGEMAVIDGGPRAATITADGDVSALELSPAALLRLLDREPTVASAMASELRERLASVGERVNAGDGPPDRAELVGLTQRLRAAEHPDWAQPPVPGSWALRFSKLFARGS
jgi:CRP/FNR family cyclic AMP-dependent transcriptional regulator